MVRSTDLHPPSGRSRRYLFGLVAGTRLASLLPGCTSIERGTAVPTGHAGQASVLGVPNERFYPLEGVRPLEAEFIAAVGRQRRTLGLASGAPTPEIKLLAGPAAARRSFRRRTALRLVRAGLAANLRVGDRHQYWGADRALRLSCFQLRSAAASRLHSDPTGKCPGKALHHRRAV